MSEKKFFEIDYDGIYYIVDSSKLKRKKEDFEDEEDFKQYCLGNAVIQIVNLLNEQQATIESLKEENEELKKKLEYCEHKHFLNSLSSSNKWFGMGGF